MEYTCARRQRIRGGNGRSGPWGIVAPLLVSGLAGCLPADADVPAPGKKEGALSATQGMSLQGMSLQGMSLQGMSLQGMSLQGMSLQGMSLQGTSLQGTSLQGTSLQGSDLKGALLTTGDGATQLRIADVLVDPHDDAGELTLYAIEAWDAQAGAWQNVCDPDPYGGRWVIMAAGSWTATGAHVDDPSQVTFACTSGVIAKCMRWGYKPWKSVNGQSLASYHQACTRMARADYCGDGVSHTRNGTLIDMYDTLGIQLQTPDVADMLFEAAWTPDGAYCMGKERWEGLALEEKKTSCAMKVDKVSLAPSDDDRGCYMRVQPTLKNSVLLYNRSRVNLVPGL